jgi:hypothetical protein
MRTPSERTISKKICFDIVELPSNDCAAHQKGSGGKAVQVALDLRT